MIFPKVTERAHVCDLPRKSSASRKLDLLVCGGLLATPINRVQSIHFITNPKVRTLENKVVICLRGGELWTTAGVPVAENTVPANYIVTKKKKKKKKISRATKNSIKKFPSETKKLTVRHFRPNISLQSWMTNMRIKYCENRV